MTVFFSVFVDKFRQLIFSVVGWEDILPPSSGFCSKLGFSLVFQKCFMWRMHYERRKKKKKGRIEYRFRRRERILKNNNNNKIVSHTWQPGACLRATGRVPALAGPAATACQKSSSPGHAPLHETDGSFTWCFCSRAAEVPASWSW